MFTCYIWKILEGKRKPIKEQDLSLRHSYEADWGIGMVSETYT